MVEDGAGAAVGTKDIVPREEGAHVKYKIRMGTDSVPRTSVLKPRWVKPWISISKSLCVIIIIFLGFGCLVLMITTS